MSKKYSSTNWNRCTCIVRKLWYSTLLKVSVTRSNLRMRENFIRDRLSNEVGALFILDIKLKCEY